MDSENEDFSNENSNGKRVRGSTKLKCLANMEGKIKIKYNDQGQPIGEGRKLLASYRGILVKSFVDITITDWHKVPDSVKEKLWEAIELKFDVDPESKKTVLQSMAICWRAFKNLLTKNYIFRFQNMPELRKNPPEIYKNYISQSTWDKFVNQRLSEGFKEKSKLMKEIRAKCKYNHRMSKKGYAGLLEELKEVKPDVEIEDRSDLWLKARETKDGVIVDEEVNKIAEKIATIKSQVKEGSLVIEGSSDVLTMALGKKDTPGHVRGMGFGVTPTNYFNLPRRGSKRYIEELESKLQEECEKRKKVEKMLNKYLHKLKKLSSESHTKQSCERDTLITNELQNSMMEGIGGSEGQALLKNRLRSSKKGKKV